MIDSSTLKKLEQAKALLTEVREDLKQYLETIPRTGWADPLMSERHDQVAEQQAAISAVNRIHDLIPSAEITIGFIWERLGRPEAAAPAEAETEVTGDDAGD